MTRILDYDALFDEFGRQKNVCTAPDLGGNYFDGGHFAPRTCPRPRRTTPPASADAPARDGNPAPAPTPAHEHPSEREWDRTPAPAHERARTDGNAPVFVRAGGQGDGRQISDWRSPYARRPVRCIDFDSFDQPDRTVRESRECLQRSAILFGSAVTAIVAIAILL